jgi:hypothetical protein
MSYVYDRDDYEEIYYQCLSVKLVEKKKKKKKKKKLRTQSLNKPKSHYYTVEIIRQNRKYKNINLIIFSLCLCGATRILKHEGCFLVRFGGANRTCKESAMR